MTTKIPAVEQADTTQEASGPSAAEVAYERASAALRDLDAQIRVAQRSAEEAQATLDGIKEEVATEHLAATHLEAEAVKVHAAHADAALRLGLVAGTSDEERAKLRVAQFDDQLRTLDERQKAHTAEVASHATERETQQQDAQQRLSQAQASIAELQTQRAHLAQIIREAHQQLGEERATAVEAELLGAQDEIDRLQQAVAMARLRLMDLQDGIIERLIEFKAHAERLDTTYGRAPELPPGARVVALRAYKAFLGTLADVRDFYDDAFRLRFHQLVSVRPDVLSDVLNTYDQEERARKVRGLLQVANIVLSRYEADHEEQNEDYRANRRARRLAGGR